MRLIFGLVIAAITAGGALAEVCLERDGATDGAVGHIDDHGHDLRYESLTYPVKGDKQFIKYCVRNEGDGWSKIKWVRPKPEVLVELSVVGGDYDFEKGEVFVGSPEKKLRAFKYGKTKQYPFSEDVDTMIQARLQQRGPRIIQIQSNPLNNLGYSITDALQNQDLLSDYFAAYAASDNGGAVLETLAYATLWLPADIEELQNIAEDTEPSRGQSALVRTTFLARSQLGTTDFANRWSIELRSSPESIAALRESGVLNGLSVGLSDNPFFGLDDFKETRRLDLAEFETEDGLQVARRSGDTGTLSLDAPIALQEWSVALMYQNIPISGFSFQRFANE